MTRTALLLSLFVILTPVSFAQDKDPALGFDYLDIDSNIVSTTHGAKFKIEIDRSFEFLGEFHHKPIYDKQYFNVSLAVFRRGEELLLIHAETLSDGSGGLDYGNLAPSQLDGIPFPMRTQCASDEDESELSANPEIAFIRSKGFKLKLPFVIEQHFATSKKGDSEIVISYGAAVASCEANTESLKGKLTSIIEVSR